MDDAKEFAELYRQQGERVLIFLTRRTWDGETALELTAETFAIALRAWRKLAPLSDEQRRAWLFTVARRQLSHYLRRARVERRALQRLGMQVPTVAPDEVAEIECRAGLPDLRDTLARELARLSETQRLALQMRVVQEQSYAQIALTLGISEQTARARVSRGLRALGKALESHHLMEERRGPLYGSGERVSQEGSPS